MKNIKILTLCGNNNYGNSLQSYALKQKILSMGVKAETVWYFTEKQLLKDKIKTLLPLNKSMRRYANFYKFTNSYIQPLYTHFSRPLDNSEQYLVGSDQVWNSTFPDFDKRFLLPKIDPKKRVSYASSFGISQIPQKDKNMFKQELQNFSHLSVREEQAKRIITSLTGQNNIKVLVDPTMLLDIYDWDKIAKKPKGLPKNEKYILSYFLGKQSGKRRQAIEKIAKENNCTIINILDKNDPLYICGPSEFLYLEKHAFLICTDSFHSSVFAFLYNRPLVIFDREDSNRNMNSRLITLTEKFHLKDRWYNGEYITQNNLRHDYSEGYKILKQERKKSDLFLRKALEIE